MKSYEFEGWVQNIERTNWGVELEVRGDPDESMIKFPQHMLFSTSKKGAGRVPDDLEINDKVKVVFIPVLNKGISKKTKKLFVINKLMIAELEVLEKISAHSSGVMPVESDIDMPF